MLKCAIPAIAAAVALAVWSMFLLGQTRYLEPLPWSAGTMAVWLLILAAFGAGLAAGRTWWALLLLPALPVGLVQASESIATTGTEITDYQRWTRAIVIGVPAIALGAFVSRTSWTHGAGVTVMALPFIVVGWAAYLHAHPIDRRITGGFLVQDVPSDDPSYRGVHLGDSRQRLIALLGRPDRIDRFPCDEPDECFAYHYGRDVFFYDTHELTGTITRHDLVASILIRDSRATTPEGVAIGDNLGLAERRLAAADCFIPLGAFDPGCQFAGVANTNDAYVFADGDPIESMEIEGIPAQPPR